jgi:hypothetical protein
VRPATDPILATPDDVPAIERLVAAAFGRKHAHVDDLGADEDSFWH